MPKRRSIIRNHHEEFVFRISDPSLTYHLSTYRSRLNPDPFEERPTLEFAAHCLAPDRFKGRAATVRLRGERDFVARVMDARNDPPDGAGSIVATKSSFEVWAECPAENCWRLGQAMQAGLIMYMLANAPAFAPKHSFLNSVSFKGPNFDALDYVG